MRKMTHYQNRLITRTLNSGLQFVSVENCIDHFLVIMVRDEIREELFLYADGESACIRYIDDKCVSHFIIGPDGKWKRHII